MNHDQLQELLLQSLEHEMGGVQVYETAIKCAVNDDLREEWEKYLEETRNHERILREALVQLEIDVDGRPHSFTALDSAFMSERAENRGPGANRSHPER